MAGSSDGRAAGGIGAAVSALRFAVATSDAQANPLVHVDRVADRSQTPAYKNLVVSLAPSGA